MSFSSQVKQEIAGAEMTSRHCGLAELSALFHFMGQGKPDAKTFCSENKIVIDRISDLVEKVFRFQPTVKEEKAVYEVGFAKHEALVISSCHYGDEPEKLLKQSCCKRAFLRGAFMTAGSISNPQKTYHFEINAKSDKMADLLLALMKDFEIEAKMIRRKNSHVVYLKEGEQIVQVLNVMSAHMALMEFENVRIFKDLNNQVNRKLNCELANLNKTVQAAEEQRVAIEYIESTIGLDELPEELRQLCELRLEEEYYSLSEIGKRLNPSIGRSGVNHRLKKIMKIAEEIRERREESFHGKQSS